MRKITKDGREILTGKDWGRRRDQVRLGANERCSRCESFTGVSGECHHRVKRGMGGGFRDDRLENLEWLCRECHVTEETSGNRTKMSGDSKGTGGDNRMSNETSISFAEEMLKNLQDGVPLDISILRNLCDVEVCIYNGDRWVPRPGYLRYVIDLLTKKCGTRGITG